MDDEAYSLGDVVHYNGCCGIAVVHWSKRVEAFLSISAGSVVNQQPKYLVQQCPLTAGHYKFETMGRHNVPDFKLDHFILQSAFFTGVNIASLLVTKNWIPLTLCKEGSTDRRAVVLVEIIRDETENKGGFPNGCFSFARRALGGRAWYKIRQRT